MTDRPIIFSAPMVRALLDGRKSQTRRVLKPQPPEGASCYWAHLPGYECWMYQGRPEPMPGNSTYIPQGRLRVPYAPGDRLWVKEAWRVRHTHNAISGANMPAAARHPIWWEADRDGAEYGKRTDFGRYRHARFMPRWASRLTLTVTDVRVQRLQEISEADAVAEGVGGTNWNGDGPRYRPSFYTLWNGLHGPEAWDANPWVAAATFTVQHGNIDQIGGWS